MKRRSLTRLLILGAEIVSGEQTFSPGLPCTRGQTVTLLYRMENPEITKKARRDFPAGNFCGIFRYLMMVTPSRSSFSNSTRWCLV